MTAAIEIAGRRYRCHFCGRFMPWAWVSSWNCFAGFPKAWCDRDACWQAADAEAVAS